MPDTLLWAPRAWVAGRWQEAVLLRVDAAGRWAGIAPGVSTPPAGASVLGGPVLPGLVNAHSHAFQRAFAGLAERRDAEADDFWSWRDRMYGVALRITPEQLQAIAAQLYVELLRGGYTQVCEFHYLQHAEDGRPYADPATLSWSLADAAGEAGIGLTVLPVLYERAGFRQPVLRHDQRRFATTPAEVRALQRSVMNARRPLLNAGVAIHSLRAASREAIATLMQGVGNDDMPVHIHIAEQTQEVDDCLAATGARPIEWLCRTVRPDSRWQLVHATHATPTEIRAVAASGAGLVLCPSTEANLGDGLPDLPHWLTAQVPLAIGSDSQVSRSAAEELRWLEYGQRLLRRERNVSAAPKQGQPATAARLFDAALAGGGRSAGQPLWGLVAGARADALVLDAHAPGLLGVAPSHALDAWVFATDAPSIQTVYVAGRAVVSEGRHLDEARIAARFGDAMAALSA
ncbi:MAG TPA: formimidoylglutamate deiminase [Burkholderiaceae bacterium]|nr:formimidoylglutamate deiminase [Burkholderiaceae bacterium]